MSDDRYLLYDESENNPSHWNYGGNGNPRLNPYRGFEPKSRGNKNRGVKVRRVAWKNTYADWKAVHDQTGQNLDMRTHYRYYKRKEWKKTAARSRGKKSSLTSKNETMAYKKKPFKGAKLTFAKRVGGYSGKKKGFARGYVIGSGKRGKTKSVVVTTWAGSGVAEIKTTQYAKKNVALRLFGKKKKRW